MREKNKWGQNKWGQNKWGQSRNKWGQSRFFIYNNEYLVLENYLFGINEDTEIVTVPIYPEIVTVPIYLV